MVTDRQTGHALDVQNQFQTSLNTSTMNVQSLTNNTTLQQWARRCTQQSPLNITCLLVLFLILLACCFNKFEPPVKHVSLAHCICCRDTYITTTSHQSSETYSKVAHKVCNRTQRINMGHVQIHSIAQHLQAWPSQLRPGFSQQLPTS